MDLGGRICNMHMAVYYLLGCFIFAIGLPGGHAIGVNYGRVGSDLPTPEEAAQLCNSIGVDAVRIFDAAPEVVSAFREYDLEMHIAVPNDEIPGIAANETLAENWVRRHVLVHFSDTKQSRVSTIVVGNELLSDVNYSGEDIVPAMKNIHAALVRQGLGAIHVSSTHAMNVVSSSSTGSFWPPSLAGFDTRIRDSVMVPFLELLNQTGSPILVNAYPYLVYKYNPESVSIDAALFNPESVVIDPISNLAYNNMFDQMVDSFYASMAAVGYHDIDVVVTETGWPTLGASDEPGANVTNAQTYIGNLASHVASDKPRGTPMKPGRLVRAFIFALFNENGKWGPETERNWGMFYPNKTKVYDVALAA